MVCESSLKMKLSLIILPIIPQNHASFSFQFTIMHYLMFVYHTKSPKIH